MASMSEGWLVGFEGGEYVVYDRETDCCDGGVVVGVELGRATVLADALDLADRSERECRIESRMEEAEAMRAGWATMTPEERDAYLERQAREVEYARRMVDLMHRVLPSLAVDMNKLVDSGATTESMTGTICWPSFSGVR